MKLIITLLLLGTIALPLVSACAGLKDNTDSNTDTSDSNTNTDTEPSDQTDTDPSQPSDDGPNPIKDKLGLEDSDIESVDNDVYDDNAGEYVKSSDELECDFEGGCCWSNEESGDDRDWRKSSAKPDDALFASAFNAAPPPDSYLLTASLGQDPAEQAHFVSCPIQCTSSDVLVTVEHYSTNDVVMEVCLRDEGDPGSVGDCQPLPNDDQPGPTAVTLPKIETPKHIVIVARGLDAPDGDVAIIDNIVVDFNSCSEDEDGTGSPEDAGTGSASEMDAMLCIDGSTDFSGGDFADWQQVEEEDQPENFGSKPLSIFQVTDEPAYENGGGSSVMVLSPDHANKNRRRRETKNEYAVCDIRNSADPNERESAGIVMKDLNLVEDRQLEFDWFDQSYDTVLAACIDSLDNCVFSSGYKNDFEYLRSWHTAQVLVPAGTQRVFIVGMADPEKSDDFRNPISHMGLDNLRWTRPIGGGPASANPDENQENVCEAKRK